MLELYHHINSVCAQKVRIALIDKGVDAVEHLMNLGGDQFNPEYLKLNPNAVVPTLVHDGRPIIESSVILSYLDEAFSGPALTPSDPHGRARMRLFLKLIDEYIHDSCTIITFATAFRESALKRTVEQFEAYLAKSPNKKRSEHRRDVIAKGIESEFVIEALKHHQKLLSWMDDALAQAPYLAGPNYSIADIAVIPYIIRLDLLKLSGMWADRPRIASWYSTMRTRPSVQDAVFGRMGEEDHAPFRNIADLWPKAQRALEVRGDA